ncbi:metal-dependent hydrolase [Roseomonas sp. OT10]|uniref:metal-dependent hydrolase n=1 Tax=Roseomonas cutis TaxID=2897332 RepID=UPI001E3A03FD|nr:metal-dependent hydrolase [Roseomonas sp. OT10]UFN48412.1 metal-dependent hydrolase [Roseomonas sp. OT10]
MRITWFGHSAYRLEFGRSVVLIDPFLSGNGTFRGDAEAATAGATHILLTHGHGDHVGDTVAIARRTGAKLVATFELCQFLGAKGVAATDPMNTGGTTDQGEFSVSLTIAFHSSSEMDANGVLQTLGLPNGLVVTPKDKAEPVVYHMGDTDIFSDMALIAELYDPAVVMVPIGDRFTMGPRSAALAVRRFLPKARTILPCHYATFPPLLQSPEPFLREMGEQAGRVRVPAIGEAFTA